MGISVETLERHGSRSTSLGRADGQGTPCGLCATVAWGLITQEHAPRNSVPQRDADPPAANRDRRRYSHAPLNTHQIQATSYPVGGVGMCYWMKRLMLWTAVYHAQTSSCRPWQAWDEISLRRDESFLVRVHVPDCKFTGSLPRSRLSSETYSAESPLQMDTRSRFQRAAE